MSLPDEIDEQDWKRRHGGSPPARPDVADGEGRFPVEPSLDSDDPPQPVPPDKGKQPPVKDPPDAPGQPPGPDAPPKGDPVPKVPPELVGR